MCQWPWRCGLWLWCGLMLAACGTNPSPPSVENSPPPIDKPVVPPSPPPSAEELTNLAPAELVARLATPANRDAAAAEVRRRGKPLVEPLIQQLDPKQPWQVRAAAAFGLGLLGDQAQAALPALKETAANDPEMQVQDAARFAIDAIEAPNPKP